MIYLEMGHLEPLKDEVHDAQETLAENEALNIRRLAIYIHVQGRSGRDLRMRE